MDSDSIISPGMRLKHRYKIEKALGRGAFSSIYLANDESLYSRKVVIKIESGNYSENQWLNKKFRQEIEALARIQHPGVVQILDYGDLPDGRGFQVMEYIEGESLRQLMRDGGMDLIRVGRLMRQLCQAVSAIHDAGIIHCDLKPENIVVKVFGDDEAIKVLDFGIARVRHSLVLSDDDEMVAGTPSYMAPEQFEGHPTPASDIYVLGIIAYEMVTGQRPFSSDAHNFLMIIESQKAGLKVMPRELRPELPPAAEAIILKALAFDAHERYALAHQFGEDLANALSPDALGGEAVRDGAIKVMRSAIASETLDSMTGLTRLDTEAPLPSLVGQSSFTLEAPGDYDVEMAPSQPSRAMAATEIFAYILAVEAGGSSLPNHQADLIDEVQTVIQSTPTYQSTPANCIDLIRFVNEVAVLLFVESVDPLEFASEIAGRSRQHAGLTLRMGIHKGTVRHADSDPAWESDDLDIARAIARCGSAGHIIVSNPVAESADLFDKWSQSLQNLGEQETTSSQRIQLFNFYNGEAGKSALPERLKVNTSVVRLEVWALRFPTIVADVPPPEDKRQDQERQWEDMSTRVAFGLEPEVPKPVLLRRSGNTPTDSDAVDFYYSLPPSQFAGTGEQRPPPRFFPAGTTLVAREVKYRVERLIGASRLAAVYHVREDKGFQEELALKVLFIDADPDALRSLLKPWKVLSTKYSDQFVRLLGVERIKGADFAGRQAIGIFMEHMPGQNLTQMSKDQWKGHPHIREQIAHLMQLFLQACRAVALLHSQSLSHGHLQASNFLLDATGSKCKLSDFGLFDGLIENVFNLNPKQPQPNADAISADIFALGATLYSLLSGTPVSDAGPSHYQDLIELNPFVSPELNQVVLRCLETNPAHRPQSVNDLLNDLILLGVTKERANTAPLNLAWLLLSKLDQEELEFLTRALEKRGFHSIRASAIQKQRDLIEEYCYTTAPDEILAEHCTGRQLAMLAKGLGLEVDETMNRGEIIARLLETIGFLPGPKQVYGIESTASYLQRQLLELTNATTSDECLGMIHSSLAAIERSISLLVRFYGQLLYASGGDSFLSRYANGKPAGRMTMGEKVAALRALCLDEPQLPLPARVKEAFAWPIINKEIFKQLEALVTERNRIVHQAEIGGFQLAQRLGHHILSSAVEVLNKLTANPYIPRTLQIVSRQDDIYGRHHYLGQDDRGHTERIFTPLPLEVGQLYLCYPLTNPVWINPILFPYSASKQEEV